MRLYYSTTDLLLSLTVKECRKWVNIWRSYGQVLFFFDSQCIRQAIDFWLYIALFKAYIRRYAPQREPCATESGILAHIWLYPIMTMQPNAQFSSWDDAHDSRVSSSRRCEWALVARLYAHDSAATLCLTAGLRLRVSQKTTHHILILNFAECLPIFKILSLLDSAVNLQ